MPIVRDESGRSVFRRSLRFDTAHPRDFFADDPDLYAEHIRRAQYRVLETIRFLRRPLAGRGLCHEFPINPHAIDTPVQQLAKFVHQRDDRRAKRVREQRYREETVGLPPYELRLRSPQHMDKRRAYLFGGGDIPALYFEAAMTQGEITHFVQRMRLLLVTDAIEQLATAKDLRLFGDKWEVSVIAMNEHRLRCKPSTNRVKHDDRSFHGEANNKRKERSRRYAMA